MNQLTNEQFVAGLRSLAAVYEAHPELPLPYQGDLGYIYAFVQREQIPAVVKAFGKLQKDASDASSGYLNLRPDLGGLKFEFTINRELVCRKVFKGMRLVPEKRIEAIEAVEARVIPEHEEEILEWECEPLTAHKLKQQKIIPQGLEISRK